MHCQEIKALVSAWAVRQSSFCLVRSSCMRIPWLLLACLLAHGGKVGEFVEVLRCFGVSDDDPLLRAGLAFLLASQDDDGTWDAGKDAYTVYHATMVSFL